MKPSTLAEVSSASHSRSPFWAIAGICLFLVACGGGGGRSGANPSALNLLKVTVSDTFGSAVVGATVQGPSGTSITDAQGMALLLVDSTTGTATVTVSRETFLDKPIVTTVTAGQLNEATVTLERATSAAGGSLTSRSGVLPIVNDLAQQMTFEIELVVVGSDSQPIEGLTPTNFTLDVCTPDPTNNRIDCLQGASTDADVAYAPAERTPEALELIPGGPVKPYAAALLLDQSGSIVQSDPTGARLFSAKAFLSGLGANDRALLAAFAGGSGAIIPTPPLAVYAPFKDRASALSYFPTLDSLASLLGGDTPLYESLDLLQPQWVNDVSLPAGTAKAVVIFTDGVDTSCGGPEACRTRREQSVRAANENQVRLFTIGLSRSVDIVALGELANKTGGAFLYADSAEQLLPLYGSVGDLLSLSLPTYRLRWTVQAVSPGAFRPGNTLLGRVQVTAGASTFNVPFIVGIP